MIEIIEEVKSEFAIQIIYDYISIIENKTNLEKNKDRILELQEKKETLKKEIKQIYNGNIDLISKALKKYKPIVKKYYNKGNTFNGYRL